MTTKTDDKERAAFEAHFSKPPFEWKAHRYGEDSAWPGNYQNYAMQCAWEAWQARADHLRNVTKMVPSDAELLKWAEEEQFFLFCDEDEFLQIAREVLSRYSSGQPATSDEALLDLVSRLRALSRYQHDDMSVADEAADALISGQPVASAELDPNLLQQFFATLDDALSKERASPWTGIKGAKFQDRMLAWDRVRELREQLLATASEAPAASAEPVGEAAAMPGTSGGFTMATFRAADVPAGAKVYAAPVVPAAQEPVGEVFTMEALDGSGDVKSHVMLSERLPAGTKLYAAPVTAESREDTLTPAARDVLAERQRQVNVEGWTPEHDDMHSYGAIAKAAACYAIGSPRDWPWHEDGWKPKTPRRNLVRAGALILAEIERLDRGRERDAARDES